MRGNIAAATGLKHVTNFPARFPDDPRSDCVAIAVHALELEPQPIVSLCSIVLQKDRGASIVHYDNIDGTIVIVVADREPSSGVELLESRSCVTAYIFELSVGSLMKQQQLLPVVHLLGITLDHIVWMAIR